MKSLRYLKSFLSMSHKVFFLKSSTDMTLSYTLCLTLTNYVATA